MFTGCSDIERESCFQRETFIASFPTLVSAEYNIRAAYEIQRANGKSNVEKYPAVFCLGVYGVIIGGERDEGGHQRYGGARDIPQGEGDDEEYRNESEGHAAQKLFRRWLSKG